MKINIFITFLILFITIQIVNAEIWVPKVGTTWNWILNADSNEIDDKDDVEVLGIDLFDHSAETIKKLQEAGHKIICYFSAGTLEYERPDTKAFLAIPEMVRDKMDEWDEYYLDINDKRLLPLMAARLDLAQQKGCDAVEPDNIDIYLSPKVQKWKKPVTVYDQRDYDIWLSTEARKRGLSIGLKNDIANAKYLLDYFDFAINEECYDFDECGLYLDTFIAANKAVFMAAYGDNCDEKFLNKLLTNTIGRNLSIIIKDVNQSLRPEYKAFVPENYTYDAICSAGFGVYNTNLQFTFISFILVFIPVYFLFL